VKVLVLGASHAETPLFIALQNCADEIATAGLVIHRSAKKLIDVHHEVDYSDVRAIEKLVVDEGYDAVLPGCNDFAAISCASLSPRSVLGCGDSLAVAQAIHLKNQFRSLCVELEIPSPRAIEVTSNDVTNLSFDLPFPLIVKPTDLTGGKGMTVVHEVSELVPALDYARAASRQATVVVEEFLPWTLHSASYIILGGAVTQILNADEYLEGAQFLVSAATMPSSLPKSILDIVDATVLKLTSALRLADGVVHVQFLSDGHQARILEICRRPPGDLYVLLPMLSSAFDFPRAIIGSQLGIATALPPISHSVTPTLRLCVIANEIGSFVENRFALPRNVETVFDFNLMQAGDKVSRPGVEKSAIIFLQSEDLPTLQEIAMRPSEYVEMRVRKSL
jgi:carbamoylphosphate synthase large subunit